ncbi:MAG: hypothetical protein RRB13_11890 [bacterium]|nr:hypothetical protein [bacterium]
MITLPDFKWWLVGPIAAAFRKMSQAIWAGMLGFTESVIQSSCVDHSTTTGFEIIKSDLVIPPPASASSELQRVYVQYYRDILAYNATPEGIALIGLILGESWFKEELRGPAPTNYPFYFTRYWTSATGGQLALAKEIFGYLAPARCVKHAQIETLIPPAGFGTTLFGARFGDAPMNFE